MNPLISQPNFQVAFVNSTEKPLSEKHICYYAIPCTNWGEEDMIYLAEVYEATHPYPNPEAYELGAVLKVINTRIVDTRRRSEFAGGPIVLVESVQNTTRKIYESKNDSTSELFLDRLKNLASQEMWCEGSSNQIDSIKSNVDYAYNAGIQDGKTELAREIISELNDSTISK